MRRNANSPGEDGASRDVPEVLASSATASHDPVVDDVATARDSSDVVHRLHTASRDFSIRQQRALRRMAHRRVAPAWVKKISRILFPVYGIMRLHDKNCEEHYEQWREQERKNYGQHEPQ